MTEQSANQVDALAVSRVGTDIVLRWRVRQDNGREFRVWFTRADTGVTYALNAVPLSSSTRVMTLDSQALAAPCGDFHLTQLLAGGTDTGPSLPVTLPVGPGGCGGGGDPPPPPPDGIHWVTRWRHLDHLGSLRLMTDESGWVVSGSQVDYYPFGMPMDAVPPSSWLFTGHEKDAATGLDYMLARMHSASVGSFTSVDPARGSAKADSPRTWNRYAYVRNNPYVRVDVNGNVDIYIGGAGDASSKIVRQFKNKQESTAGRTVLYFSHTQVEEAIKAANAYVGKEPVNIIGHSWGAHSAVRVAAGVKGEVATLVAVDPVRKPTLKSTRRPANVRNVVVVKGKPKKVNRADIVEALGKLLGFGVPRVFSKQADTAIEVRANHEQFAAMYTAAGEDGLSAKDIVDRTYETEDQKTFRTEKDQKPGQENQKITVRD